MAQDYYLKAPFEDSFIIIKESYIPGTIPKPDKNNPIAIKTTLELNPYIITPIIPVIYPDVCPIFLP